MERVWQLWQFVAKPCLISIMQLHGQVLQEVVNAGCQVSDPWTVFHDSLLVYPMHMVGLGCPCDASKGTNTTCMQSKNQHLLATPKNKVPIYYNWVIRPEKDLSYYLFIFVLLVFLREKKGGW